MGSSFSSHKGHIFGKWRALRWAPVINPIYGICLSDPTLQKVYYANVVRELGF